MKSQNHLVFQIKMNFNRNMIIMYRFGNLKVFLPQGQTDTRNKRPKVRLSLYVVLRFIQYIYIFSHFLLQSVIYIFNHFLHYNMGISFNDVICFVNLIAVHDNQYTYIKLIVWGFMCTEYKSTPLHRLPQNFGTITQTVSTVGNSDIK